VKLFNSPAAPVFLLLFVFLIRMEELVSYDSSPKRLKSTFQSTSNFSGEFLFDYNFKNLT